MDVAKENMADIPMLETGFIKTGYDVVERRFRAGIEQHDAINRFEGGRRHDAGVTKMKGVENLDHRKVTSDGRDQSREQRRWRTLTTQLPIFNRLAVDAVTPLPQSGFGLAVQPRFRPRGSRRPES